MILDKLLGNQSVIISLDVDNFLFERLEQITDAGFVMVEINSTDQKLLSQIIAQCPEIKIGAGGIIDTQQLENCYQAGVTLCLPAQDFYLQLHKLPMFIQ